MREEGEWYIMFDKELTDPNLPYHSQYPKYDPWDCLLEELLVAPLPREKRGVH